MSRPPAPPPRRLGKYRVEGLLAEGGMGTVYRCRLEGEEGFRKRLAAKVVHPRYAGDGRFRERFLAEARLAATLVHPNLVQVFDFGREGELLYLVMERVEGFDLAAAASQARALGEAVPPCLVRHWADGLLGALAYLHGRGIVHGDVAPSNVMVTRDGAVKVGDLGLARRGGTGGADGGADTGEPPLDRWAGKAGYAAPEVVRGEEGGPPSDLFSAAVTVAELLLPRRVFPGGRRHEYPALLATFDPSRLSFPPGSEGLAAAILPSLNPDPAGRHADAHAFRASVRRAGDEPPVRDLQAAWDRLFPVDGAEEETVLPSPPTGPVARGAVVARDEGRGYGRGLKAGAAAALLLVAGGVAYMNRGGDRPAAGAGGALSSPPDRHPSSELPSPSSPPNGASSAVRPAAHHPAPNLPTTGPPGGGDDGPSPGAQGQPSHQEEPAGREGTSPSPRVAADAASPSRSPAPLADEGSYEAIQATPWARVYLGDRSLGVTPLFGPVLPAGEQALRFVNEELAVERVVRVTVKPGNNGKLILRLRE